MPQEDQAVRGEVAEQAREQSLLGGPVEVDDHVAAEDQVVGRAGRLVLDEIVPVQGHEPAHPLRHEPPVALDGTTLAPEVVAEMVLSAILENRLYVITHPESLEPIRRRFQRIERAILEQKPRSR